jgi:hypothetical protein
MVAFVVKASLSLLLSRMTEFSPVRITRFTSTVLIVASPGWFLMPHDSRTQRGHNFSSEVLGPRILSVPRYY